MHPSPPVKQNINRKNLRDLFASIYRPDVTLFLVPYFEFVDTLEEESVEGFMPKYWAVVTIAAGPTFADITIDGTFIPVGSSSAGGLGGHRVIDTEADPVPFVFHAKGFKGFPVSLGIVLSPLPSGTDIKFNSVNYKIPESGILTVPDGKIPIKKVAPADAQLAVVLDDAVGKITPPKKAATAKVKPAVKKGGKGE